MVSSTSIKEFSFTIIVILLLSVGTSGLVSAQSNLVSPQKQFESGVAVKDVKCEKDLELILKVENGDPVCVKPTTAQTLFDRGWAKEISDSNITEKFQSMLISKQKAIQIVQNYIKKNNITLEVNTSSSSFRIASLLEYVQLSHTGFAVAFYVNPITGLPLQEKSLNETDYYAISPQWWIELEKYYLGIQSKRIENGYVVWIISYHNCTNCIANEPIFMVDAITGNVMLSEEHSLIQIH